MELITFIKSNKDWKEKLSKKPYCLKYNTNDKYPHLILLKYNQINSNFYEPIVRECRGIILDITDQENPVVVCYAFNKFGNHGEGYADKIDWTTARIQEKIDGSILKVWFDHKTSRVMLSTNGTIDAYECPVPFPFENIKTFGDAFDKIIGDFNINSLMINSNITFIFELTGPYNKVVIQYPLDIYHIGTRKNYEELDIDIGIKKPNNYKFSSIEETVSFANTLSSQEEGFVVVDNNWNRVKIKGKTYVQLHHLLGERVTPRRIIALVLSNEDGEFLQYFKEYTKFFDEIKTKYFTFVEKLSVDLIIADALINKIKNNLATRKDYAQWVHISGTNKSIMFSYADNKFKRDELKEFLSNFNPDKVLDWL